MTFREKFYKEFPEEAANPAEFRCPSVCGYEDDWNCESPKNTDVTNCDECWDREMPDQKQEPKFNIDIEPFIGIRDQIKKAICDLKNGIQEDRNEIRKLNDGKARLYLTKLSELQTLNEDDDQDKVEDPDKIQSETQDGELIEFRSKGLNKEERTILMDAMEKGLRRIRHYREKGDFPEFHTGRN